MTNKLKLGVMVPLNDDIQEELKKVKEMGLETCQLSCWDLNQLSEENAKLIKRSAAETGIEITAFWCGWPKPAVWDFMEGYDTLGLVPSSYRFARMEALINGSNFAKEIGISDIVTHVGFIPENPNDPEYSGVVSAVKYVAQHCKRNNQFFLFETGQETPITLKRLIQDVGLDNLGVNLDPANLLLYGKGNPIDALDILGEYIKGVHAKDGEYPTDGRRLGEEKPLGQGRVNFPLFISKLKEIGYTGALTIEREISGEEQIRDIYHAKEILRVLV